MAALMSLVVAKSTAQAADPGEVEDLIRRGVELRRGGNDNRALPLFKKAYDLVPTPRTAAQLGLVEMALGYQIDAERHLTTGLESPRDFWIQKNRVTLENALRTVRAAIGELAIQGSPAGAEIWLNGTQVGRLPLKETIRIVEGRATVEVRAAGHVTETRSVVVTGAKRAELTVNLRPTEAVTLRAPEPRRGVEVETPAPDAAEASAPREAASDADPESSRAGPAGHGVLRTVAWVTAAAAVLGVGLGVVETVVWRDKQDQFDHVTRPSVADPGVSVPACGVDEVRRGSLPSCGRLYDDFTRARTLAIVAFAGGAGLAVGAAVLFFLSSRESEAPVNRHALACAPLGGLTGAVCELSF